MSNDTKNVGKVTVTGPPKKIGCMGRAQDMPYKSEGRPKKLETVGDELKDKPLTHGRNC
jgi:hypothetical protein